MKQIFGFGSLINTDSLLATASNACDIRPCYIKGFRREFNLFDVLSEKHHFAGLSYCALDIQKDSDPQARVNGVLFTVDRDGLAKLIERERGYKLLDTAVYDFKTGKELGTCLVFSACKNDGKYDFESSAQGWYTGVCLKGVKQYGDEFYQAFLDTTFVGDKRLSELPELIKT